MVSSYAAFGIVFMFFWGIYYLCNKNNCVEYSRIELLLFYIFTRIVPVLMIPERKTEIWILLIRVDYFWIAKLLSLFKEN